MSLEVPQRDSNFSMKMPGSLKGLDCSIILFYLSHIQHLISWILTYERPHIPKHCLLKFHGALDYLIWSINRPMPQNSHQWCTYHQIKGLTVSDLVYKQSMLPNSFFVASYQVDSIMPPLQLLPTSKAQFMIRELSRPPQYVFDGTQSAKRLRLSQRPPHQPGIP